MTEEPFCATFRGFPRLPKEQRLKMVKRLKAGGDVKSILLYVLKDIYGLNRRERSILRNAVKGGEVIRDGVFKLTTLDTTDDEYWDVIDRLCLHHEVIHVVDDTSFAILYEGDIASELMKLLQWRSD